MSGAIEAEAFSLVEYLKAMGCEPGPIGDYATNKDMLIMVLTELGRVAHIDTIHECYRRIRMVRRPDWAWKSDEQIVDIVRSTLRRNAVGNQSSDVREEERCFIKCEYGLGYWGLVPGVRYDKEKDRVVWDKAKV